MSSLITSGNESSATVAVLQFKINHRVICAVFKIQLRLASSSYLLLLRQSCIRNQLESSKIIQHVTRVRDQTRSTFPIVANLFMLPSFAESIETTFSFHDHKEQANVNGMTMKQSTNMGQNLQNIKLS